VWGVAFPLKKNALVGAQEPEIPPSTARLKAGGAENGFEKKWSPRERGDFFPGDPISPIRGSGVGGRGGVGPHPRIRGLSDPARKFDVTLYQKIHGGSRLIRRFFVLLAAQQGWVVHLGNSIFVRSFRGLSGSFFFKSNINAF
jgi:hypothetical protein